MKITSKHNLRRQIRGYLDALIARLLGLPKLSGIEAEVEALRAEVKQLAKQQQALCHVMTKIRASLDLESVFRAATKEVGRLLGVDRVAVYRFDEDWGGEFVHSFEFAEPEYADPRGWQENPVWDDTCLQEGQGGRFRQNEAFCVEDVYEAGFSRCHLDVLEQYQIRAYAVHPIFSGDRLWGLLGAYQHSKTHAWSDREHSYLSLVASQLGFALRQAWLACEEQCKTRDLHRSNARQALLFDLVAKARDSFDLGLLLRQATREIRQNLNADRVAVFQFDADSSSHQGEFIAESVLPAYGSVMLATADDCQCFVDAYAPEVRDRGQIHAIPDVFAARLPNDCFATFDRYQVSAQIAVPLLLDDRIWGLLFVQQCSAVRDWSASDLEFVRQIADYASVVLVQSSLHDRIEEQEATLEELVRSLECANREVDRPEQIDRLTGAVNRPTFDDYLDRVWADLAARQACLSVIAVDIDGLHRFNDAFGEVRGDVCLRRVSQCLQTVVMSQHSDALFARYEGPRFAIVLPGLECDVAAELAEKLRQAVRNLAIAAPKAPGGFPVVTASLGVFCDVPDTDGAPLIALDCADLALRNAKEGGRDTWRIQRLCGMNIMPTSTLASRRAGG